MPLGDARYYTARPTLAIPRDQALPLVDGLGFAPGLAALKPIYDAGQLTVVQGVGYPNPSRSHFRSIEIWQTGSVAPNARNGWLGRYLDANCCGDDDPLRAVNIGNGLTRSLWTDHTLVPSVANVEGFTFPTVKGRDLMITTIRSRPSMPSTARRRPTAQTRSRFDAWAMSSRPAPRR